MKERNKTKGIVKKVDYWNINENSINENKVLFLKRKEIDECDNLYLLLTSLWRILKNINLTLFMYLSSFLI